MIRLVLWLLGALLLGGIVHLGTVLILPRMASQDAYARVSAIAPVNAVVPLANSDPGECGAAIHGSGLRGVDLPL